MFRFQHRSVLSYHSEMIQDSSESYGMSNTAFSSALKLSTHSTRKVNGNLYSCQLPAYAVNIIFNNGSVQTRDLKIPSGQNWYDFSADTRSVYGGECNHPGHRTDGNCTECISGLCNPHACHILYTEKVHPLPDALILLGGQSRGYATNKVTLPFRDSPHVVGGIRTPSSCSQRRPDQRKQPAEQRKQQRCPCRR